MCNSNLGFTNFRKFSKRNMVVRHVFSVITGVFQNVKLISIIQFYIWLPHFYKKWRIYIKDNLTINLTFFNLHKAMVFYTRSPYLLALEAFFIINK